MYFRKLKTQYVCQGLIWTGNNFSEVYDFLTGEVNNYVVVESERLIVPINGGYLVKTRAEGNLVAIICGSVTTVPIGDYILLDHCYCVSSCSPEELERDYEIVDKEERGV